MAKVTEVIIRRGYRDDNIIRAVVSATLDDMYVIHGIKILNENDSYYIAMPSIMLKEGRYKDIFHPLTTKARHILQKEVLELYFSQREKHGRGSVE